MPEFRVRWRDGRRKQSIVVRTVEWIRVFLPLCTKRQR